jgi:glycine/D-amino acid oxidase-like deaminating enzyme
LRRIAVIGAGIVGASVAFQLARSGEAQVWIVERSSPGSGTTSSSFAWANANEKTPRDYFELNRAGLEEHFRLREELPDGAPWLHPGGNIEWEDDEASLEELERRVERLRSWGYAAQWCKALWVNEVLEPNVAFPSPNTPVAYFPDEVWVDAPRLANTLAELARQQGAETCFNTAVEEIETSDGHVAALRLGGGERLPVDAVVNAAGPEADRVAAMLGRVLSLRPSKGLLVHLAVERNPISRLVHAPYVNLRPEGPGRVLVHHGSIDEKLESGIGREDSLGRELLERARLAIPALEVAKGEDIRVGVRPMPEDGLPCVGAVLDRPGYYEAVTHSGVTLGPLLGRLLTRELLDGEVDTLTTPFRPAHFTQREVRSLPAPS